MPSKTDFNVSPYYDDFAESKKFHRVMYRPAFAVQARELTTQQSILQNQIEKLADSKPEKKLEFKEILAYGDEKVIEIGAPTVEGAKVEANILKNSKNRTILIFKKRRRQNSRRKNGHRQEYSMIRINKIFSKDGKVLSEAEKISKTSKKEEVKEAVSK